MARLSGKVVLLVEDDAGLRGIVRDILVDAGAEVFVAADGREALRSIGSMPKPDLVLTDHSMPGMNGSELYLSLRERPGFSDVNVAFFSAKHETGGLPLTVIPKPIHLDTFLVAVEDLLGI